MRRKHNFSVQFRSAEDTLKHQIVTTGDGDDTSSWINPAISTGKPVTSTQLLVDIQPTNFDLISHVMHLNDPLSYYLINPSVTVVIHGNQVLDSCIGREVLMPIKISKNSSYCTMRVCITCVLPQNMALQGTGIPNVYLVEIWKIHPGFVHMMPFGQGTKQQKEAIHRGCHIVVLVF